jgi:ElaB/YqjD/DUF883 family membrane-anchored ribosome-binding protein
MLTLRNTIKNSKIKNRYNIIMVYKTKKINRRRYLKKQSKRKMYGGANSKETQQGMPVVQETQKNSREVQETQLEIPSLQENLKQATNLLASAVTNVSSNVLKNIGEKIGVDPNKSASETVSELKDSMKNVVTALNSVEGEELKKEAGELLKDSLDVLKPSIEKAEDIIDTGVKKLTETGASAVMTAVNEFPPMFALSEASKAVTAAAQAGETVAELTTTGSEAYENLQEQREKASSLLDEGIELVRNVSTDVNKGVSNIITSAKKKVDDYGRSIIQKNMPKMPQISTPTITQVAGKMKNLNKEAKMIGGRIRKSQIQFLSPNANKSKKRNNQRRRLSHRL